MDNGVRERLCEAVEFIKRNGYAKNDIAIARSIGASRSSFSMAMTGMRMPTWDMVLSICDIYHISFDWIRKGNGRMVAEDREPALLKRIEELEKEIAELKSGTK